MSVQPPFNKFGNAQIVDIQTGTKVWDYVDEKLKDQLS